MEINMTEDDKREYKAQVVYYSFCGKFHSKIRKFCKARDNCHYTGKYRDAAHSICNLWYKENSYILVSDDNPSESDNYIISPKVAEKC